MSHMPAVGYPTNWIRFGPHKKREFLKDYASLYDGLAVPAHILAYQYKATPTLLWMCADRPFFVDPMTHALAGHEPRSTLKPSVAKLAEVAYSIPAEMLSKGALLTWMHELSDTALSEFVMNVLRFEREFALDSFAKYGSRYVADDFGKHIFIPKFLQAPYVCADSPETVGLGARILSATPEVYEGVPVYPTLHVSARVLAEYGDQLAQTGHQRGTVLWVDGFDEADATDDEIYALGCLVKVLSRQGGQQPPPIIALHAGYFTMTLHTLGLGGISHGTLFGENRSWTAATGKSGPPPIRYYIRQLHQFYPLDAAVRLCEAEPSLLCDCGACRRVVRGNPQRIAEYAREEELAEIHFLYNRYLEKRQVGSSSLEQVADELELCADAYENINTVTKPYKTPAGVREKPVATVDHLRTWRDALRRLARLR